MGGRRSCVPTWTERMRDSIVPGAHPTRYGHACDITPPTCTPHRLHLSFTSCLGALWCVHQMASRICGDGMMIAQGRAAFEQLARLRVTRSGYTRAEMPCFSSHLLNLQQYSIYSCTPQHSYSLLLASSRCLATGQQLPSRRVIISRTAHIAGSFAWMCRADACDRTLLHVCPWLTSRSCSLSSVCLSRMCLRLLRQVAPLCADFRQFVNLFPCEIQSGVCHTTRRLHHLTEALSFLPAHRRL